MTLLVAGFLSSGCGNLRATRELFSLNSPTGTKVARVLSRDPFGPADYFNFEVWIESTPADQGARLSRKLVWSSEGVEPVCLTWPSELDLKVGVLEAALFKASSIRLVRDAEIRVETGVVLAAKPDAECRIIRLVDPT